MHYHVNRTDRPQPFTPSAVFEQETALGLAALLTALKRGSYRVNVCSDLLHEFSQIATQADQDADLALMATMTEPEMDAFLAAKWAAASGGKPLPGDWND